MTILTVCKADGGAYNNFAVGAITSSEIVLLMHYTARQWMHVLSDTFGYGII